MLKPGMRNQRRHDRKADATDEARIATGGGAAVAAADGDQAAGTGVATTAVDGEADGRDRCWFLFENARPREIAAFLFFHWHDQ